MKKSFLIFILSVLLSAFVLSANAQFSDISGHKHANAINTLSALGIVGGNKDGSFNPDNEVTRAQMAKMVYVLSTTFVDVGTGTVVFEDVPLDHWANPYICWCYHKGIIEGTKFYPDDRIDYNYALKMICGALGYTDFNENLYPTDVRELALVNLGLDENLEGVKGQDYITRGQLCQLIYNAMTVDMKETKIINIPIGDTGYIVPMEIPKILAVDVWRFEERLYTVVATENKALSGYYKTGKDDVISLDDGSMTNYTLEDLGFEDYIGNTDSLLGKELIFVIDCNDGSIKGVYITESVEIKKTTARFVDFKDISQNKYANAIKVLAGLGIVGYTDGNFYPDTKVTRAEMAKLVFYLRTTLNDFGAVNTPFEDVDNTHWASLYINWCYYKGIVGGTKFYPSSYLTYDFALKMICGALGYTDFNENLYPTDVRELALVNLGLDENLEGVKGQDYITRGQLCQLVYNAMYVDMNETKTVYIWSSELGCSMPVEVAKTLAVDLWGFLENRYTVVATENEALPDYNKTGKDDIISLYDGRMTNYLLEDIKMSSYKSNTDALLGKEIIILVNRKSEIFASALFSEYDPEALDFIRVTPPTKTEYKIGEYLDTTGMRVTGVYNNLTTVDLTDEVTVEEKQFTTPGTERIKVTYKDKSGVFEAFVLAPQVSTKLTSSDVKARQGKTVEIPISISENEGLAGLFLEIDFDRNVFEFVSATKVNDGLKNLEMTVTGSDVSSPLRIEWDGTEADSSDGQMVKLIFKVKENIDNGAYEVKIKVLEAVDFDTNDVEIADTKSKVTVKNYTLGDINDDDEIDLKDVILLRRYLVGGYDITYNADALDVNKDSEVGLKDVITLRRYVVGGYGVELN